MSTQTMRRAEELCEWDKVNALERPWTPEDDPIPEVWTIQHLQRRLVEAMRVLAKMPGIRGPKQPGGHWPKHTYEWADRLAWEELPSWEKRARDARQNYVNDRPTVQEIHRMDLCLGWLTDFRHADRDMGALLSEWAALKATEGSVSDLCDRTGQASASFYRRLKTATDVLVRKLNAIPVPVF